MAAGVAYGEAGTARAGMGADAADYDGSGWQSLVHRELYEREHVAVSQRWLRTVYGSKPRLTGIAQMSNQSLTFGSFFFDYDLDGLPDILAVMGTCRTISAWYSRT